MEQSPKEWFDEAVNHEVEKLIDVHESQGNATTSENVAKAIEVLSQLTSERTQRNQGQSK